MTKSPVVTALLLFAGSGIVVAQEATPEVPEVAKEHQFLKQFVGEWECEGQAFVEPGKPPVKSRAN